MAYAALEERLRTLRDTVIENYNPKRPIEALWPAFIDTEKQYQANSDHAKKYPVSIVSGFRADWYYQGIWNFPEIHEMIRSQGGLSGQWYDAFRVEMGDLDPDWNLFHLHDGRSFRLRDDKNYQFYTDYNERLEDYSSTYSFSLANPNTAETIQVYPDTLSDAELEALQGWNYNVNPYTGKNISRKAFKMKSIFVFILTAIAFSFAVGESFGDFQLTEIAEKNVTLSHNTEEIRLALSPIFFLNAQRR